MQEQTQRDRCSPAPGRPPPLVIGTLEVAPPVILAPMSGITTLPMRTLCEEAGCGLTVTEFLAAPALSARVPREVGKLTPSRGRPFGAQIFGRDPGQMARAARMVVAAGAALVDINMGCPARKVTKGVSGAALMREPDLAESLVRAVAEAAEGVPVTIKIRSGWDESSKNAPEFAARMVDAGARAVTVHGRTRQQGFTGQVDLETIARVVQRVDVPVIGNGDVTDATSLERMFRATGCAGVMVGRAALGNPWIFSVCRAWWTGEPPPPAPTLQEKLEAYLRQLDLALEIIAPEKAVLEMRKFAGWYLRDFPGAALLRKRLVRLTDLDMIRYLVTEVLVHSAQATVGL
jgi:tRNA-dihydrouridine synthase B